MPDRIIPNGSTIGGINNGSSVGGLGLGGTNQTTSGLASNVGSIQRPRKILSDNVPPTNTIAVQQHQQQLEQQQNSLRKNNPQPQSTGQNNLGLATGVAAAAGGVGVGTANALKVNRKDSLGSKPSTETVPEEEGENEREVVEENQTLEKSNDQDSSIPTSEISLNDPESSSGDHPLGVENESNPSLEENQNDSGGGRPLSPQDNLIPTSSSSDDSSSSSSNESNPSTEDGTSLASSNSEEDFEGDQVTAIFRPGGKGAEAGSLVDQSDWAKLKEAGLREREKRELERRKREGEASKVSSVGF